MKIFGKNINIGNLTIFSAQENLKHQVIAGKLKIKKQNCSKKQKSISYNNDEKVKYLGKALDNTGRKNAVLILQKYFKDKKLISGKMASLICG